MDNKDKMEEYIQHSLSETLSLLKEISESKNLFQVLERLQV